MYIIYPLVSLALKTKNGVHRVNFGKDGAVLAGRSSHEPMTT